MTASAFFATASLFFVVALSVFFILSLVGLPNELRTPCRDARRLASRRGLRTNDLVVAELGCCFAIASFVRDMVRRLSIKGDKDLLISAGSAGGGG